MAKILFLSLEQVLGIHHYLIETFGGQEGVRDLKMLESAIHRPQSYFGGKYLYPTLFEKASALMYSIAMNHPFMDANKRTAVVSSAAFLHFNGWDLAVSQKDLFEIVHFVISKKLTHEQLTDLLRKNSIRVDK